MMDAFVSAAGLGLTWGWLLRWRLRAPRTRMGASAAIVAGTLLLGAEAWVFLASAAACVFLGATAAGAVACHAWMADLNRRRDDRRRSVVAIGDGG